MRSTGIVDGERVGWSAEYEYRSEPIGADALELLKQRMLLVKGYDKAYPILYSRSGFTERTDDPNAELYTLEDALSDVDAEYIG